jgi:O-antigen ligase
MFLAGSREASRWIDLMTPVASMGAIMEGNPIDSALYSLLIAAGIVIVLNRKPDWGMLLLRNTWIWLYFLFCVISILWSDYPLISMSRWIKAFGNVIMVLVILTEEAPYEALGVILRRLAYIVLPLSVLFIKYYPHLGRSYHATGRQMYNGVCTHKNGLGQICMILAVFFIWDLLYNQRKEHERSGNATVYCDMIALALIGWLMFMADSATSYTCLVVAASVLLVSRIPVMRAEPNRLVTVGMCIIALLGVLEATLDMSGLFLGLLGRDSTLTTRVPMWYYLAGLVENPALGAGYDSFWLGDRLKMIWRNHYVFHQAHNGYLEIYLNLGFVGLALLAGVMISGVIKIRNWLNVSYAPAILRLCFVAVVAMYNWTEAAFYGISNMWILLLLGIMDPTEQPDQDIDGASDQQLDGIRR